MAFRYRPGRELHGGGGRPDWRGYCWAWPDTAARHDTVTVSVLHLVFATVVGAGALIALIVAYRRQIAEADSAHDRRGYGVLVRLVS
jgi:hypothetical protein